MDARRRAHPAPVDPPRNDVSADERRDPAPPPGASRRSACDALFHEQPRRRGRGARERVRHDRAPRATRHDTGRGRAQSRARDDRLVSRTRTRSGSPRSAGASGRAARRSAASRRAVAAPAHGRRAHRRRVLHLRDRLDPHAHAGARRRDALVRADAVGVHPRHRVWRLLGARPHRPRAQPARLPRRRADRDGAPRARDAPALRRDVRSHAARDQGHREDRRRLRHLSRREPRHRARSDVSGSVLRRDDAPARHLRTAHRRPRRALDRRSLRREHRGLDRRRDLRRAPRHAVPRPEGPGHRGRGARCRARSHAAVAAGGIGADAYGQHTVRARTDCREGSRSVQR